MTFEPNPVTTEQLVEYLTKKVGNNVGCNDIKEAGKTLSISYATACKRLKSYKTGIGKWNLTAESIEKAYQAPSAQPAVEASYVPSKDETFTKFGSFDSIQKIIKSKLFYPAFITGLSGNGKTLCVEQSCAIFRRHVFRRCTPGCLPPWRSIKMCFAMKCFFEGLRCPFGKVLGASSEASAALQLQHLECFVRFLGGVERFTPPATPLGPCSFLILHICS